MSTSKSIHIFKAGTHTAMSGATLAFSEADLRATVGAYDPKLHEAPLVVGHPKADAPAYGWVGSLSFNESGLHAEPTQVDAEFADLVSAGRFKKISASFYMPDAAANPVPGVFYLRHVGFFGAQPPAIKGLKQAEFADADEGIVEFSEWDDAQNASLWRNLREWLIGKFSQEEADQVIPQYAVQRLEQSAQQEIIENAKEVEAALQPSFHEPQPGATMSDQDKARLAELEAENARLKKQQADFAEQQKRDKVAAHHASHLAFAEGLIKEGRLLPFSKELVVATLDYLANAETVVEFGEGDGKKPLIDAVKTDWLAKLPKQIEFGEQYADKGDGHSAAVATADEIAVAKQLGLDPADIVKQRS